ncbi:GDP-mannose 4,6-dehydratase [Brevibacillus borstelensis]|uniref:NAD-dependent epimerase/dehydratase family protein n=1 Tax=Brevibacillus borstelensis TaxID=45462 RepID=UPI002E1A83E3|nr:NAD-dependent epimerase/dehydratase family protein [Brevibacillus borstelensis]MED2010497.1 GDP-mannose 4,6-dehydratase [Brevibacillus borstelensis]
MRVLVTGGAGFIGSHIVELLVERGHDVTVVDNLSTGDRSRLSRDVLLVEKDIREHDLVDLFRSVRPEAVIHQAAQVDVAKSMSEPLSDGTVNVMGTLNVVDAAVKCGAEKIVFASSCAVYGETQEEKIKETHPIQPISLYGASKWLGEWYLHWYSRFHAIDVSVLRYSNVYGPRQGVKGEGGVVSIFTKQLLAGKTPVIFGDGKQTRDFVYVKDVAMANVQALSSGSGTICNISTGVTTTVQRLCELLQIATGKRGKIDYQAERSGDIRHSCLDNEKAREALNWKPVTTLRQGLEETVAFFANEKEIGK